MCLCVSQGELDLQKPTLFLFVRFLSCNTGDGLMRLSMIFWPAQVLAQLACVRCQQVNSGSDELASAATESSFHPLATKEVHVGELLHES